MNLYVSSNVYFSQKLFHMNFSHGLTENPKMNGEDKFFFYGSSLNDLDLLLEGTKLLMLLLLDTDSPLK